MSITPGAKTLIDQIEYSQKQLVNPILEQLILEIDGMKTQEEYIKAEHPEWWAKDYALQNVVSLIKTKYMKGGGTV